mmetsp:Transcript_2190/g.5831  ORF Transcript_2190/g.5831 Transcript_2190/m.5831 type:complete len:98 (-) Transcript_2190:34-327(-)
MDGRYHPPNPRTARSSPLDAATDAATDADTASDRTSTPIACQEKGHRRACRGQREDQEQPQQQQQHRRYDGPMLSFCHGVELLWFLNNAFVAYCIVM